MTFISTHTPREQEVFSFLRRACVRSLSCEVCPGREGPLFFGDAESGYVFSYAFFLRDTKVNNNQKKKKTRNNNKNPFEIKGGSTSLKMQQGGKRFLIN